MEYTVKDLIEKLKEVPEETEINLWIDSCDQNLMKECLEFRSISINYSKYYNKVIIKPTPWQ